MSFSPAPGTSPFLLLSVPMFLLLSPSFLYLSLARARAPSLFSPSLPSFLPFPLSRVVSCGQIPSLGIRADAITFANCTMESEKFITVREQAGDAVMIHMVRVP